MIFQRAQEFSDRTAIVTPEGTYAYRELLAASAAVAAGLLDGRSDLEEARIAFLVPPGFEYVAVQWGIWRAGGVAVPLAVMHPPAELDYVIRDAEVEAVVVAPDWTDRIPELDDDVRLLRTKDLLPDPSDEVDADGRNQTVLPTVSPDRRALILYTSGTTGKPKGVVTTHANIQAQVDSLVRAWEWTDDDHILHVLPLHHIHGIINVLCCALWSGACCEFLPKFDAHRVLHRFADGDLTLFMAVPTIYSRLIAAWESLDADQQAAVQAGCREMRLMVSGSAALPVTVLENWEELTGHVLLERYGMTEIGMALSNSYRGERVAGHVGHPLPDVDVRLAGENGHPAEPGQPGEIEVRGPGVFLEYWNRPEATQSAFRDGWFRTGDVAALEPGGYRILGRESVDIIKTGGYKVSALEIEETLRTHPAITECAVVGLSDDEWGQRVAVCAVCEPEPVTLEEIREWARSLLAPYKLPTRLLIRDELPRNAMGKVNKPELRRLWESAEEGD